MKLYFSFFLLVRRFVSTIIVLIHHPAPAGKVQVPQHPCFRDPLRWRVFTCTCARAPPGVSARFLKGWLLAWARIVFVPLKRCMVARAYIHSSQLNERSRRRVRGRIYGVLPFGVRASLLSRHALPLSFNINRLVLPHQAEEPCGKCHGVEGEIVGCFKCPSYFHKVGRSTSRFSTQKPRRREK